MAASSSSFFPRISLNTRRPGGGPALRRAVDAHGARAEHADPRLTLNAGDEDEIDDLLPWFAPDSELAETDLADDWSEEDDASLTPFVSDEDEPDEDDDEGP